MRSRIPLSLISLALGGFGIGLTEFVIMGLLPEVAAAMNVTISQAGHYIAAYALGVVVGAPLLVLAGRSYPPKKLLKILMIIFTVFNGLSALAPNSWTFLLLRFLSGLPHGAFFGVGAVVASRIAPPGKAASAIAVMLGGLTICNIIGVPLATYLSQLSSWRAAFGLVAVIGAITFTAIHLWLPELEPITKGGRAKDEFVIFKNSNLWFGIAIASIGFGGFFSWFSYINPLLTHQTAVAKEYIPYFLSLAGLGMTVGNWLGGRMADSMSALKAAVYLLLSMTLVLILNSMLSAHLVPMIFLTFITGANAMAMGSPIQILLLESSKESPLLGSSIGQGAFNMGNSLGAFLGGLPLAAGLSFNSPLWVGTALAFGGLLIALSLKRRIGDFKASADTIALH
ncbi:MFS transporter [Bdellovibrio sp. SKB1291214]|uniref:MFS transporter n=1 Tax=Bdellovibrio sp. SKB1291214 TaxID=1732569 RepID=UPI000B51D49C|nr:MFS transporter [Bdellovibrio sp. SKB1291214]UYL07871.1 MFS transporter [Bdellovibrio sp. SKB1291214]